MFIPLVSTGSLFRRKGGGGKGSGSKSSSSSKGTGTTSITQHRTGTSSTPKTKTKKKKQTKYKSSSSPSQPFIPVAIPAGRLFAGRNEGGGTRQGIYGTSTYGSGYPASYAPATQAGTSGLGFPYYFWPIAWGGAAYAAYDYRYTSEYGDPTNSSRPGGPLVFVSYPSKPDKSGSFFRLMADNGTMRDMVDYIAENCSSVLPSDSLRPGLVAYTVPPPHPDQTVQYYRASTVALTLDAFNASSSTPPATFAPNADTVDTRILECLNYTIGENLPLDDGALGLGVSSGWLYLIVGVVSVLVNGWV